MCASKGIRVAHEGLTMGLLHQPRTPPTGTPWGPREREEFPTGKDGRAEPLSAGKRSEGDIGLYPELDWVFWTHFTDEKAVVQGD